MGVDAIKYREKRRKTLTMPSGDVATIRKPGRDSYMKLLDAQDIRDKIPTIKLDEINTETGQIANFDAEKQQLVKEMMNIMDEVLVRCVIDPRLSLTAESDSLGIDELDIVDYFFLIQEVFEYADMSEEKMKGLFRPRGQPTGKDGGENSVRDQPEAQSDPTIGTPPG